MHRCFACGHGIAPHDMVYKLKPDVICHLHCQRCFVCGLELGSGTRICVDQRTRRLLCVMHSDQGKDFSTSTFISNRSTSSNAPIVGSSFKSAGSNPSSVIKSETAGSLSPPASITGGRLSFGDSGSGNPKMVSNCGSSGTQEEARQQIIVGGSCSSSRYVRRRGPRTTIRPMQLETLNRIFGTTPKPSKQARARLALETGLSMRVIQVRYCRFLSVFWIGKFSGYLP